MAINQYCWHGSLHHECDECAKDRKIKALEQEVERLKGMEPLLKMFLKDGYSSPSGKISKKTAIEMVRYVAANRINAHDL